MRFKYSLFPATLSIYRTRGYILIRHRTRTFPNLSRHSKELLNESSSIQSGTRNSFSGQHKLSPLPSPASRQPRCAAQKSEAPLRESVDGLPASSADASRNKNGAPGSRGAREYPTRYAILVEPVLGFALCLFCRRASCTVKRLASRVRGKREGASPLPAPPTTLSPSLARHGYPVFKQRRGGSPLLIEFDQRSFP